jgi:signal transduction histidine kinase
MSAAGLVRVSARREDSRLCIEVRDDGPGLATSGRTSPEGVGLSNTRKRLNRLYGENHRFFVGDGEHGGAVAVVEIPFVVARP